MGQKFCSKTLSTLRGLQENQIRRNAQKILKKKSRHILRSQTRQTWASWGLLPSFLPPSTSYVRPMHHLTLSKWRTRWLPPLTTLPCIAMLQQRPSSLAEPYFQPPAHPQWSADAHRAGSITKLCLHHVTNSASNWRKRPQSFHNIDSCH